MEHGTRRAIRLIPIICLLLSAASGTAQDFYWETPRSLAEGQGRFPALLQVKGGLLALWQESQSTGSNDSGDATGNAWISAARLEAGEWTISRRFAGPYPFTGSEPLIYSAASDGDEVAIAASSGDGRIEIQVSHDGGRGFSSANGQAPNSAAVAPRIYRSATGGWLLFVTQGSAEALNLSYSTSPDGLSWKDFQPFISAEDGLSLNFLPTAAHLESGGTSIGAHRDVVVFQSLLPSSRPTFQLYAKTSTDGGLTWDKARRITAFQDPVQRDKGGPDNFDNQRPWIQAVGGKLWVSWERRPLGSQPQIYVAPLTDLAGIAAADVDMVSTGSGSCGAPQLHDAGGLPAVSWFDNRRGGNRVYLATRNGLDWNAVDLSGGSAEASFGRVSTAGGRTYAIWQATSGAANRIVLLAPDTTVGLPSLSAVDFSVGKRTRAELATIRVDLPADSSGIEGYSWIWSRDPKAVPPRTVEEQASRKSIQGRADADGAWYLAVAAKDFAGNWSAPARIRFDRDRTPPPAPLIATPSLDDKGFLAASSFELGWAVPDYPDGSAADDVAGYTWSLSFARDLGKEGLPVLPQGFAPKAALPPPTILGTAPRAAWRNVDDGFYVFTVRAIDSTGNISEPASILVASNKYVPYTSVAYADSSRDDFGRTSVRIVGRGYLAEGTVDRVVIDRDGREPYDLDRSLAAGDFRVLSDREISGIAFEDLEAGNYRIGLHHPKRGWYWTAPTLSLDISGTLKFGGQAEPFRPSWAFATPKSHIVSIYDVILVSAFLFAALGLVLAGRQTFAAVQDAETVRLEVLALVRGGPMPTEVKARAARTLKRRGLGLRVKVTFTITVLVVFIVVLVSVPLGIFMTQSESSTLANGLRQRAYVLLESVAQGGRSYLPSQDILQLAFLPQQAQAMEDAAWITVTGYGSDATTDPDVVWASNDPDILSKIDTPTLQPGVSRLRDDLSAQIPALMADINQRAGQEVGDLAKALAEISQEGQKLATKLDAASQRRLAEIGDTSKTYEKSIAEKLLAIANGSVGALPAFEPSRAASREGNYVFFKPILYRQGQDGLYYRGMVRLEAKTNLIVESVRLEQRRLYTTAAVIAAIALGLGLAGAFLLSSIIVVPIKKLVKAIETIRDEEDKENLEGLVIEVASRDELYTLADTVNQMTDGLAKAAKASKELTVGKGIQKMFIPLTVAPGSASAKLSSGHIEEKGFEVFGYYEGAKGVSGDYWDFRAINSRYWYFIKCDISGKGVSAALIMVEVATMVINFFGEWEKTFPRQPDLTPLVYQINNFINEMKYKGRFAAFTVGVLDADTGKVIVCDAGDYELHWWNGSKREFATRYLTQSPAAGPIDGALIELKSPYTQDSLELHREDILLLYTDGIEEANRTIRDASAKPMDCSERMEPGKVLGDFLSDNYFKQPPFNLPTLADPKGAPLFSSADPRAFARSLAAELSTAMSDFSVENVLSGLRDGAAASFLAATMADYDKKAQSASKKGPWKADDESIVAVFTGSRARTAIRRALEEGLASIDASVKEHFLAKPAASYLGETFAAKVEKGLEGLGGQIVSDAAKSLEKRHHELEKERMGSLLREPLEKLAGEAAAEIAQRFIATLTAALQGLAEDRLRVKAKYAHLGACLKLGEEKLAAALEEAVDGPCAPAAVAEMAKILADRKKMFGFAVKLVGAPVYHQHHLVGTDREEFGRDRVAEILHAVDARTKYELVHDHSTLPPGSLTFDFSSCKGSLEEKVVALVSIEKVFRVWKDDATTDRDQIIIDEKLDDFLEAHFDQYRLYFKDRRPHYDPEKNNPGYRVYAGLKENEQYDDLTILAIRRK